MSQSGPSSSLGGGGAPAETLTGNTGGAVGPDGSFNINVVGNNMSGINIVGNPGANTLTVIGELASTSQQGTVVLASNAQAIAGFDSNNAVTSSALAAKLGTQTTHSLALFEGSGNAVASLGVAANGYLPIGSTGVDPVLAPLTPGTGITITNGAGSITISATGTSTFNYTYVDFADSPYTVLSTDDYLGVDTTLGIVVIKLPNAPPTGTVYIIKDSLGNSATNAIHVTTVGGSVTIDGNTTYTISTNYEAINVIFNGTSYEVF